MSSMPLWLTLLLLLVQTNKLMIQIVATPVMAAQDQSLNSIHIAQDVIEQTTTFVLSKGSHQKQHQTQRKQQPIDSSVEITCLHAITTAPISDTSSAISAYGILFTISSPYSSQSNKEMVISSLGFYVDIDQLSSIDGDVNYEVYTLSGYYADPDRTNEGNGGLPATWDYRGNLAYWDKIAEGAMGVDDLRVWPPDDEDVSTVRTANYFQIPFDEFQPTSIEEEGIIQSFYITLRETGALLYAPLDSWEDMHDEQDVSYCGDARALVSGAGDITSVETGDAPTGCVAGDSVDDIPILQIGEGVVSYPFPTFPYFYQTRKFMGSIYYLNDCTTDSPSTMPSATLIPSISLEPSHGPTLMETIHPSHSHMPTSLPSISPSPTTLSYIDAKSDGCHSFLSTDRQYETLQKEASYGIVFPIKSDNNDDDGVWITSLGFHVNFSAVPPLLDDGDKTTVNYEVYALFADGLYADPNRTSTGGSTPETFDYRGDFSLWKKISMGTISEEDLVSSGDNYFQIPWTQFEPIFIPPYGLIRSFYLTLDSGAFVYKKLERKQQLGKTQKDDDFNNHKDKTQDPPSLMYGEVVIGYPFHNTPFLYSPSEFIGRVFYEYECPSQAPSFAPSLEPSESPSKYPSTQPSYQPSNKPSPSPSGSPSLLPSSSPSLDPTVSHEPSFQPTDSPSVSSKPSQSPSIEPTATVSPTHAHFPSSHPSVSISPSERPSWHPTISQEPSRSPRPSSHPSSQPSSASCMSSSLLSSTLMGVFFLSLFLQK